MLYYRHGEFVITSRRLHWTRSVDGLLCGVCKGICPQLGLSPTALRILWVCSIFFFGLGLLTYLICALCLPREDNGTRIEEAKVLGVCNRLARLVNIEVGLIRCLFSIFICLNIYFE